MAFEHDPVKGLLLGLGIALTITVTVEVVRYLRRDRHVREPVAELSMVESRGTSGIDVRD